jgi:hypothetical protein
MDFEQMLQGLMAQLGGAKPQPKPGSLEAMLQMYEGPTDIGPSADLAMPPPTVRAPAGVDIGAAMRMLEESLTPPELKPMNTAVPARKAPRSMDFGPMLEALKAQAPKDTRRSAQETKDDQWLQMLSGAAGGASGATSVGEALMGAGGGAASGMLSAKQQAREESIAADEAQRQWQLSILEFQMQADSAKVAAENATNETEYANAMGDWQASNVQIQEANNQAMLLAESRRAKAQAKFDFMSLDAQQRTAAGQAATANEEIQYKIALDKQAKQQGVFMGLENNIATYMITKDGRQQIKRIPLGLAGEISAGNEILASLSSVSPDLAENVFGPMLYSMTEKMAPGSGKLMLMMNLQDLGYADDVFLEERPSLGEMGSVLEMFKSRKQEYNRILTEANKNHTDALKKGADPAVAMKQFKTELAVGLLELMDSDPAYRKKLESLDDPRIKAGVSYLD